MDRMIVRRANCMMTGKVPGKVRQERQRDIRFNSWWFSWHWWGHVHTWTAYVDQDGAKMQKQGVRSQNGFQIGFNASWGKLLHTSTKNSKFLKEVCKGNWLGAKMAFRLAHIKPGKGFGEDCHFGNAFFLDCSCDWRAMFFKKTVSKPYSDALLSLKIGSFRAGIL